MTTKPTGEELFARFYKGDRSFEEDFSACYDAGIQHAREEMAQKRGPRPDDDELNRRWASGGPWTETFGEFCFSAGVAWADSGTPEPAPASEELVERCGKAIWDRNPMTSYDETGSSAVPWDEIGEASREDYRADARAVLAEITPGDVITHVAKAQFVDNESLRAAISTLEARVKELEREAKHWESEAIAFKVRDDRHIAELATAREQHRAEVEELKSKTSTAEREHKFEFAARRKVEIERDRFMSRLGQTQAQLAVRDEELGLLRQIEERLRLTAWHGYLSTGEQNLLDLLDAHRAKASPPPDELTATQNSTAERAEDWIRRRCISDEGPPRVGDVVRVEELPDWEENPCHELGRAYVVAELRGNVSALVNNGRDVSRCQFLLVSDDGKHGRSMGTWCRVTILRRAQPSPVASEPLPGGHGPHHGEIAAHEKRLQKIERFLTIAYPEEFEESL